MLKTKEMAHVTIVGLRESLPRLIQVLHDLKLAHIRDWDFSSGEGFYKGAPLETASSFSQSLVSFRSIASHLGIKRYSSAPSRPDLETFSRIESQVINLLDSIRENEACLKEIDSSISALTPFRALGIDLDLLKEYRNVAVFTGFCAKDPSPKLKEFTSAFEVFSADLPKRRFFAVFISKEFQEKAAQILQSLGFDEIPVPSFSGDPSKVHQSLLSKRAKIKALISSSREKLEAIRREHEAFLASGERYLSIETNKAELPLKFLFSENTFILDAFVPKDSYQKLEQALSGLAHIAKSQDKVADRQIPIAFDNPSPVKPYESLLDVFTLPKYSEADPSALMFLFFPVFFGFMLGDIGYGLTTLAIFLLLKRKLTTRGWQSLLTILIHSSIVTIAFGFVFGEFFGLEQLGHYKLPHLLVRMHDIIPILLISVAIGVAHLNIGYIVGFFNVLKIHGFFHAVKEKASWMLIQLSVALIILSYLNLIPLSMMFGAGALLFSFALLVMGEGMISLVELIGLLSNILSYSRLLAIGLSSAAIAFVVNLFAGDFFAKGGINLVFMVILLLLGHSLNILIGSFGSFLHSLRLHYVEFFSKFYTGGGTKYLPFGKYEEV